jgi:chromate reductase
VVGSNRRESINRKLAYALVQLAPAKFVANLVQIDDLPMYNKDLESPSACQR